MAKFVLCHGICWSALEDGREWPEFSSPPHPHLSSVSGISSVASAPPGQSLPLWCQLSQLPVTVPPPFVPQAIGEIRASSCLAAITLLVAPLFTVWL